MTGRRWFDILVIGVPFPFLIMASFACGSAKKEHQAGSGGMEAVAQGAQEGTVPVETAVARRRTIALSRTYPGSLEGEEQANVVSRLAERIVSVQVHVGDAVTAGQVAIVLDRSGASSQFIQAEATLRNSEKTLHRTKALYDEGAVALQVLDGAQTAYEVAKANFDAARSSVELAAPISGVVTAVNARTGDLAMPGVVLATVAQIAQMKVTFNINETDALGVPVGRSVQVVSEATSEAPAEGRIVQISRSADARSRSFEVKAIFPNTADRRFRPGMFCKVKMEVAVRENALVVPVAALQSDGAASGAYAIRGGRAERRVIETGLSDGDDTEVLAGLADGDSVVTAGLNSLRDGSLVRIVDAGGSAR